MPPGGSSRRCAGDATLGWSGIGYDDVAGTANGAFNGSRWLALTGLTGSYGWMSLVFEPSSKVFALWEQSAYAS